MEPEEQSLFKALTGPKPQREKKILLWAEYISKTRFDMYPSIHHDVQQQNVTGRKRWCYCLNHIINLTSSLQKNTSMNSHTGDTVELASPCHAIRELSCPTCHLTTCWKRNSVKPLTLGVRWVAYISLTAEVTINTECNLILTTRLAVVPMHPSILFYFTGTGLLHRIWFASCNRNITTSYKIKFNFNF